MKKIISAFVIALVVNTANAAWTPYVNIVTIKSPLGSDNLYILGDAKIGVTGCANAKWLYLRVDETLRITPARIKAAQALAMGAKANDQQVRASGTCFNSSYFQVEYIEVR